MKVTKLIICEPYLFHFSGHCYEYCVSTAEAAQELGLTTEIFGNRQLKLEHASTIHPWLGPKIQAAPQSDPTDGSPQSSQKDIKSRIKSLIPTQLKSGLKPIYHHLKPFLVGHEESNQRFALKHSWSRKFFAHDRLAFGPQVIEAIWQSQLSEKDHVFLPTTYLDEFGSLLWAMEEVEKHFPALPLIHLVLRRDPREAMLEQNRHSTIPDLQKLLRSIEKRPLLRSKMRLYCDTLDLVQQYKKLSPLKFEILPIPFRSEKIDSHRNLSIHSSSQKHLVFVGEARREKGFHLLPDLISSVTRSGLKWSLQASGDAAHEDAEIRSAITRLEKISAEKNVTLLKNPLSPDEYYKLLTSADLIVLPYLPEAYLARSSGVFAEALTAQVPTVVPAQTWMGSMAKELGCGVLFEEPEGLSKAVSQALDHLEELRLCCVKAAHSWTRDNTARHLVEKLLKSS